MHSLYIFPSWMLLVKADSPLKYWPVFIAYEQEVLWQLVTKPLSGVQKSC